MSDRLPMVRPQEMIRVLERIGFERLRKSPGGHLRYGHRDGRWKREDLYDRGYGKREPKSDESQEPSQG